MQSSASPAIATATVEIGPDTFEMIDRGDGPAVVFLHGAPGDLRTWAPHCAILSDSYRCIAPTQRWFGSRPWRKDGPAFGTTAHAEDIIALIQAVDLKSPAVVAWSYAAHAALHAALTRPDVIGRVLVYEPGVPSYVTDPQELAAFGESAQAMFGPIAEAVQGGDLGEAVRRLIDGSGGQGHFDGVSPGRRAIHLENAHVLPRLFTQTPPAPIGPDDLRNAEVLISVAWGSASQPAFAIPSRAAARAISSGPHAEVAGVGHLWPEEDPEGFTSFVRRWLEGAAGKAHSR